MVALTLLCVIAAVRWPAHLVGLGLLPYSFVGNSLAMVPYDWYIPAFVQQYPAWSAVAVALLGTVVVEFWNMELLERILSREGTAAFRGHHVTLRLVRWFRKAPWCTLVAAGAIPVVPFFPSRVLATLGRYPMARYQAAVVVGRGVRYTGLAGLGLLLPVPVWVYFALSVLLLGGFGLRLLRRRAALAPE